MYFLKLRVKGLNFPFCRPSVLSSLPTQVPTRLVMANYRQIFPAIIRFYKRAEGWRSVRSLPPIPKVPGSIPGLAEGWTLCELFPAKVHSAFHPFEVGQMSTSIHGPHQSVCWKRLYMLSVRWGYLIILMRLWAFIWRRRNINAALYLYTHIAEGLAQW